jgi:hypothetical protein
MSRAPARRNSDPCRPTPRRSPRVNTFLGAIVVATCSASAGRPARAYA